MPESLAKLIDLALLHPTMTDAELRAGCEKAKKLGVATVCIKPYAIPLAVEILKGSGVGVGTVIGFPHGSNATEIKAAEAKLACEQGATELDMVVNIGKVLSKDWTFVSRDIKAVVDVAHQNKAIVKVIFENCFLQDEHKIELCKICGDINADFVKTSTGYGATGATDEDLRLMRKYSPAHVKVKAAGGVRTFDRMAVVREIVVSRVGATATKVILDGAKASLGLK